MKLITLLILIVATNNCNQKSISEIQYEAVSRGFYFNIEVKEAVLHYSNNRNPSEVKTYELSSAAWKKLKDLILSIELETINTIEAPSSKSHYDGAASATLSVLSDGKRYVSGNFDHGNPPNELKKIVEELISLIALFD